MIVCHWQKQIPALLVSEVSTEYWQKISDLGRKILFLERLHNLNSHKNL